MEKGKSGIDSCILGVTNDKYELPVLYFETIGDLARYFHISKSAAYSLVYRGSVHRRSKLRYIKVEMEEDDEC